MFFAIMTASTGMVEGVCEMISESIRGILDMGST